MPEIVWTESEIFLTKLDGFSLDIFILNKGSVSTLQVNFSQTNERLFQNQSFLIVHFETKRYEKANMQ